MGDMGLPENRGFEWYSPRSEGNLYRENEVFSLKNISQTPGHGQVSWLDGFSAW